MTDTVLFACVHNAGRSQLAMTWFNRLADPTKARAISAGTEPAAAIHPEVAAVMKQEGLAIGSEVPQRLTPQLAATARVLVTMGCGEACPVLPGVERQDWPIADPKGRSVDDVRAISDEIRGRVQALIASRGWGQQRRPGDPGRPDPACGGVGSEV